MDWFKIGNEVRQGCILSPCLFNLYAEYIMQNARLGESQAVMKTARRNINNLKICRWHHSNGRKWRELNSLLRKVKEESEKTGLKLNIQKAKIMSSCPITSWQIDGEKVETVIDFYFLGLQNHCEWWLLLGRKAMTKLDSILTRRDITLPTSCLQSKLWFFQ